MTKDEYIAHHGVNGMKWGVRNPKYQKRNGSLNSAGRRHFNKEAKAEYKSESKANTKIARKDHDNAAALARYNKVKVQYEEKKADIRRSGRSLAGANVHSILKSGAKGAAITLATALPSAALAASTAAISVNALPVAVVGIGALRLTAMGLQAGNAIRTVKDINQNSKANDRISKNADEETSRWYVKPKS